jgi:RNA polymerase sigma-70 factor (ECF subfamily)
MTTSMMLAPNPRKTPTPERLTTTVLVVAAQTGDRDALGVLVERYYERIHRLVRTRLGPGLRALFDSTDVTQETFAHVTRDIVRFEPQREGAFLAWLSRIAETTILGLRKYLNARKRGWPATTVPPESVMLETGSIADAIDASEAVRRIGACLERLEPRYREILVLRDYAGHSWGEVARLHGRPSDAAARMMHAKALCELERLLATRDEA